MTKAQKKLKIALDDIGWKQMAIDTGISSNSLYGYARSIERCLSMKILTARVFLDLYGIQFSEWWEDYEVLAVCEACGKDIIDEDDWKSDSEGVDLCEACMAELIAESNA